MISRYCSIIGVTREFASAAGGASGGGGAGMFCWIVMRGANYKISLAGPIGLRPVSDVFPVVPGCEQKPIGRGLSVKQGADASNNCCAKAMRLTAQAGTTGLN